MTGDSHTKEDVAGPDKSPGRAASGLQNCTWSPVSPATVPAVPSLLVRTLAGQAFSRGGHGGWATQPVSRLQRRWGREAGEWHLQGPERDDSEVKGTGCSSRRPGFNSSSHRQLTTIGYPMPREPDVPFWPPWA